MAAISSPAILRLASATAIPYASVERMTRPLIPENRWVSRDRRELLASDLASLLNALMSLQPTTDAADANSTLRRLEYKSTWPPTATQEPALGEGTWGELLERMIETAPSDMPPSTAAREGEWWICCLPHDFEVCFNPLVIALHWRGNDGRSTRTDLYGPPRDRMGATRAYGTSEVFARKAFVSGRLIQIAGEILRDSRQAEHTKSKRKAAARPGRRAAGSPARANTRPKGQSHRRSTRAEDVLQQRSPPDDDRPDTPA